MVRVIVPEIPTVVAGVNTKTGVTGEPAPVYARVMEVKAVTPATMASAGTVLDATVSADVCMVNVF